MSKKAILAVHHDDERNAISGLLVDQRFEVHAARTGYDVMCLVEDFEISLIVTDIQLEDMQVWKMLSKLKENKTIASLPMIVLSDESVVAPLSNFPITLVVRPVALTSLRQIIRQLEESL